MIARRRSRAGDDQEKETSRNTRQSESRLGRTASDVVGADDATADLLRVMTVSIAAQSRRLTRLVRPRVSANSWAIFIMKDLLKRPRMR